MNKFGPWKIIIILVIHQHDYMHWVFDECFLHGYWFRLPIVAIYPLQGAITAIKYFDLKQNLSVCGSTFLDPISCMHHTVYTYTYLTTVCYIVQFIYYKHALSLYTEEGKIVIFTWQRQHNYIYSHTKLIIIYRCWLRKYTNAAWFCMLCASKKNEGWQS